MPKLVGIFVTLASFYQLGSAEQRQAVQFSLEARIVSIPEELFERVQKLAKHENNEKCLNYRILEDLESFLIYQKTFPDVDENVFGKSKVVYDSGTKIEFSDESFAEQPCSATIEARVEYEEESITLIVCNANATKIPVKGECKITVPNGKTLFFYGNVNKTRPIFLITPRLIETRQN